MSSNFLQLTQQVTNELGLAAPTYVIGNTNQEVIQISALMNAVGYELTFDYDWRALQKEFRFYTQFVNTTGSCAANSYVITNVQNFVAQDGTDIDSTYMVTGSSFPQDTYVESIDKVAGTVTLSQRSSAAQTNQSVLFSKTQYDLPLDYHTIADRTQWDKSKHWEMLGPEDAQQWQWLKSGYISTGPRIRWRILGEYFQTWPPMNTQEYLGFEYRSKGWVESATGETKNSFTADTDTCLFPDRIVVLATKLKFFQIKNFDTTSLLQDYNRYLSVAKAEDKGSPNLSFAPQPSRVLIGYANIPDTGYGS
jgi:hypothetical protein